MFQVQLLSLFLMSLIASGLSFKDPEFRKKMPPSLKSIQGEHDREKEFYKPIEDFWLYNLTEEISAIKQDPEAYIDMVVKHIETENAPQIREALGEILKLRDAKHCSSNLLPLLAKINRVYFLPSRVKTAEKQIFVIKSFINRFDSKQCEQVILDSFVRAEQSFDAKKIETLLNQLSPPDLLDEEDQELYNRYLTEAWIHIPDFQVFDRDVYREFLTATVGDRRRAGYKYEIKGKYHTNAALFSSMFEQYLAKPCKHFYDTWSVPVEAMFSLKATNGNRFDALPFIRGLPEKFKTVLYRYKFCKTVLRLNFLDFNRMFREAQWVQKS